MTPTLLSKTLSEFLPRKDHLAMLGISVFSVGIVLLAALFPWLSSSALFVAWPFLCAGMFIFGLLVTSFLYSTYEPVPASGSITIRRRLNQIVLWIYAPFFTLWLVGVLVLLVAGTIFGFIHLYWWLAQNV